MPSVCFEERTKFLNYNVRFEKLWFHSHFFEHNETFAGSWYGVSRAVLMYDVAFFSAIVDDTENSSFQPEIIRLHIVSNRTPS